jgi:hypothetical protein
MAKLTVNIGKDNGYQMMGGEYFMWRATLGGQEYGSRINAGRSEAFDDAGIATCVRQMNDSIQKIVYGETQDDKDVEMAQRVKRMLEAL